VESNNDSWENSMKIDCASAPHKTLVFYVLSVNEEGICEIVSQDMNLYSRQFLSPLVYKYMTDEMRADASHSY
jgi:hypothetical protein